MFDGFGMCSNYKSPLVMFTVNYEDNCPYIEMEHEERDGEK